MANEYTYRADHIGGLVMPAVLIEERKRYAKGEIDLVQLREAQDTAIKSAVEMQRGAGIAVMTDGGFRRAREATLHLEGNTLAKTEAALLRTLSRRAIKVAVPAARPDAGESLEHALGRAEVIKKEIEALIAFGVDYVQLDAPGYSGLFDNPPSDRDKWPLDQILQLDRVSLAEIERPAHVRIAVHFTGPRDAVLRSTKAGQGNAERALQSLPADRFVLPMENADSDFDLLCLVPEGKVAALGLVSAARPALEDIDDLMSRLDRASKRLDGDNLALSSAAGFASSSEISESDQRRKLELIADVATRWWGFAM